MSLSYTMRWPKTEPPPVQSCCQKRHGLPHQHIRFYEDKRGRVKHWQECSQCYKTRHIDGHPIRWRERDGSLCRVCDAALRKRLAIRVTNVRRQRNNR